MSFVAMVDDDAMATMLQNVHELRNDGEYNVTAMVL